MGMPGWRDVLGAVADAWRDRRDEIREGSGRIAERLRGAAHLSPSNSPMNPRALDDAAALRPQYDAANGGFGRRRSSRRPRRSSSC